MNILKCILNLFLLTLILINTGCETDDPDTNTNTNTVTVQVSSPNSGTVISTPPGINCNSVCEASFTNDLESVELAASAAAGYRFSSWEGDCNGSSPICRTRANNDRRVVANFELIPSQSIAISLSLSGSGRVYSVPAGIDCSDECTAHFSQSSEQITLNAEADENAHFVEWQGDCQGATPSCIITPDIDKEVTAIFASDPPTLSHLSLINTQTNTAVPNYSVLAPIVTLNLNSLPTDQLSIVAVADQSVGSVRFGLDSVENYRTESLEPYAFDSDNNGDINTWSLSLGDHTITATPYELAGAKGAVGQPLSVAISITNVQWATSRNAISFTGLINSSAPAPQTFDVFNIGNTQGEFTVSNIPAWLSVTPSSGTLDKDEQDTIRLTANACAQTGTDQAGLTISGSSADSVTVDVSRLCAEDTTFDLTLDRVYINQSVPAADSNQSAAERIKLIANRAGLLRAFVSANENSSIMPQVELFIKNSTGALSSVDLIAPTTVPVSINEGQENNTYNTSLTKDFFSAGTEIYVEVDPNNLIVESNENNNRYPESGYIQLDIITVPILDITFVPITIGTQTPNVNITEAESLLQKSLRVHPLANYDIAIRDQAYTYTGDSWGAMLSEIRQLRLADGSSRYYHGLVVQGPGTSSTSGIGYLGLKVAVSRLSQGTIAHELGHNFDLPHAPCGGPANPDPNYPYPNAKIGIWGLDIVSGKFKNPDYVDLMSYCGPSWISDYNYNNVLDFRGYTTSALQRRAIQSTAGPENTLIVNGVVTNNEVITIGDVFEMVTPRQVNEPGPYDLLAYDALDIELFRIPFRTYQVDHSNEAHFHIGASLGGLSNVVAKLQIIRNGKLLAQRKRQQSNSGAVQIQSHKQTKAVRLSDNEIQVHWDSRRYKAVLIRDPITRNILGKGQNGSVTIQTKVNEIELILSSGLGSETTLLTVESKI